MNFLEVFNRFSILFNSFSSLLRKERELEHVWPDARYCKGERRKWKKRESFGTGPRRRVASLTSVKEFTSALGYRTIIKKIWGLPILDSVLGPKNTEL